jgi:hypothetical protein
MLNELNRHDVMGTEFDFNLISGLVTWIDVMRSPMTLDTSGTQSISQINDLSVNGNHFAQATKNLQPSWTEGGVPAGAMFFDSDATNPDRLLTTYNSTQSMDVVMAFIVCKPTITQANSISRVLNQLDGSLIGWAIRMAANNGQVQMIAGTTGGATNITVTTTDTMVDNKTYLISGWVDGLGNLGIALNGNVYKTTTITVGSGMHNSEPISIGNRTSTSQAWKGNIYTALVYNNYSPTTMDFIRQKLNQRWKMW